jgi:hypothetical protein
MPKTRPVRSQSEAGFTFFEALVAILVATGVILALLTLVDSSTRLSKVQGALAEEQQGARYAAYQVVREARMVGAGGLPASRTVGGVRQLAVTLTLGSTAIANGAQFRSNNVGAAGDVVIGGTHYVRPGTDLLHIRGVLTTSLLDLSAGGWTPPDGGSPGSLRVVPCSKYRDAGTPSTSPCFPRGENDMSVFADPALVTGRLFVMNDSLGNVGVGLIQAASSPDGSGAVTLTISTANAYAQSLNSGGAFPAGLTSPSRGGVLDDRVFFIDNGPANATCNPARANQSPGPCHPVLSVAELPGSDPASPIATARVTGMVSDIEDLQVAYGIDFYDVRSNVGTYTAPAPASPASAPFPSDASISILDQSVFNQIVAGTLPNVDPVEASGAGLDEWIWNAAGEPAVGTFDETTDLSRLRAILISVVAKAAEPDMKLTGQGTLGWPVMDSTAQSVSSQNGLRYSRRVHTIRVNPRNLQR